MEILPVVLWMHRWTYRSLHDERTAMVAMMSRQSSIDRVRMVMSKRYSNEE